MNNYSVTVELYNPETKETTTEVFHYTENWAMTAYVKAQEEVTSKYPKFEISQISVSKE
jgi:hypothetical protein